MATIAEIRKEYPQYSDMTDTQLADAFHSKFYSDIPKDTFYTQLGIKTTPVSNLELMFGAGSPIARTIKGAVVDPALAVKFINRNKLTDDALTMAKGMVGYNDVDTVLCTLFDVAYAE